MGSSLWTTVIQEQQTTKEYRMTSLTFLKYCGHGFGEEKPLQLGERLGLRRDMERNVKGYKAVKRQLAMLKTVLDQQQDARDRSKNGKSPKTQYYKSLQGIKTTKSSGGIYFTEPVGRLGTFCNK